MKRHWTNEELAEHWTLLSKELDLVGDSKTDHTRLGAACLLKYFQHEGRFPAQKQDVPPIVIVHLAQQLGVIPEKIIPYDWEGRTIKAHRAAIRTFLGVHEATLADEETMVEWLCQQVLAEQRQEEALIASVYTYCKEQHIEPPTPDRVRRLVHIAIHRFDERLCATIMQRHSVETRTHLDALLSVMIPEAEVRKETMSTERDAQAEEGTEGTAEEPAPPRPQSALHSLKQDAGPVGLERVLQESAKLERIHQLGLPADLFAQISAKTLDRYRQRVAVEELQEVRRHPDPIRFTLLAAYCWRRRQEIVEILRRFTRNGVQHPTYTGLLELGKVRRTIFLCNYLQSEALRKEIQEGLNIIENWNSATNFIHYGRHGELSTNKLEDQELAMLALHLLQIALVYVQTLMIQEVLSEPACKMTREDLRGLTPLIYSNVNPYGLIRLNMTERLAIERAEAV